MEYRDYLQIALRHWWIILLCTVLAVGGAGLVTLWSAPRYAATTSLFVSFSADARDPSSAHVAGALAQQRAKSYVAIASSRRVATAVINELRLRASAGELQSRVKAEVPADTVVIQITITDSSARWAQLIADAWRREFVRLVTELEQPEAGKSPTVRLDVVDLPDLPAGPTHPRPVSNLMIGLAAGLLTGVSTALLRGRPA